MNAHSMGRGRASRVALLALRATFGHAVSANASNDAPVRFLAYFTCDRPPPHTVPLLDSSRSLHD